MKIKYIKDNVVYYLTNNKLNRGDKVFPISKGTIENNEFYHNEFEFNDFPNNPHIIEYLVNSDDKLYETKTSHGYGPIEQYFKIQKTEILKLPFFDETLLSRKNGCTSERLCEEYEIPSPNRIDFKVENAISKNTLSYMHILVKHVSHLCKKPKDMHILKNKLTDIITLVNKWLNDINNEK